MSDLISRSALLKYLRDYKWEFAMGSDFSKAMEMIDAQPTAYDEDKVVEEIMVLHYGGFCPSEDTLECVLDKSCSDCYRERITDIVKRGGVE